MCQPLMYIFTDIEPDIRITPILYCAPHLVASPCPNWSVGLASVAACLPARIARSTE